jgi:ABC-type glycerol-3-phosphate transport system substrate-binding protein
LAAILCSAAFVALAEQEPVTLNWVGFGFEANGTARNLIERYKEVAPHVTIEYQELGPIADADGMRNFDTLVAAGEQIDIAYLTTAAVMERAVYDAVLPLNEAIELNNDDFEGDYGKLGANAVLYDGGIYGVPRAGNTFKVFYNKTMAEENGIVIPDQMTQAELREVIKEFQKVDGLTYPACFQALWVQITYGSASVAGWQQVVIDEDGKVLPNYDDPRFRDSLQFFRDLALEDKLIPSTTIYAAESLNRRKMLADGQTGLIIDGPFTLIWLQNYMFNDPGEGQIPFELGVSELPTLTEEDKTLSSYNELAGAFFAPKTCANLLEAYRFMRFVCNENFDINGVYMPIYKSSDLETAVTTFTRYTSNDGELHTEIYPVETAISAVTVPNDSFLGVFPLDPSLIKYIAPLDSMLENEFPMYLGGEVTLDAFIASLTAKAQEIIDEIN